VHAHTPQVKKLRYQTPTTHTKNITSNFSQALSTLLEDGSQTIRNISEWFLIVFNRLLKYWYNVYFNLWVLYNWVHWSANKSEMLKLVTNALRTVIRKFYLVFFWNVIPLGSNSDVDWLLIRQIRVKTGTLFCSRGVIWLITMRTVGQIDHGYKELYEAVN